MVIRRTEEQIKRDVAEGKKVCTKCLERLPEVMFRARRAAAGGRVSKCRECERKLRDADTNSNRRTAEELEFDIRTGTKVCNKCNSRLPFDSFRTLQKSTDGRNYTCKDCYNKAARERGYNRAEHLRKRYSMTVAEYGRLHKLQGGKCAICNQVAAGRGLFVDHNHETGEIRGLLCHGCNTMLGLSKDSEQTLSAGADYLRRAGSYNKEVTDR